MSLNKNTKIIKEMNTLNNLKDDKAQKIEDVEGKTDAEDHSFDSVLSKLKLSGRYHIRVFFLIGLLVALTSPHPVNYIFVVENVNYRCKYENCDFKSALIPNSTVDYKCQKYGLLDHNGTCTKDNFNLSSATDCTEWVYEKPTSFVAEFNLACQDWKRTLVGTAHSTGFMIGLLVVNPMSDIIGRKKIIIVTTLAAGVIGITKSLVKSFWLYIVLEAIEPILGEAYTTLYTMAIEIVKKNDRAKVILIFAVGVSVSQSFLALMAYLIPNWRMLVVSLYAPSFLFILYIFCMDESPRWLLTKGKKAEAHEIIKRAAKTNNIVIEESIIANLKCENSESAGIWVSIQTTLSSKTLIIRAMICICMWFTSLFSAYSLLINAVSLEGDKYVNYSLVAVCSTISGIILYIAVTHFKRKGTMIFVLTLTSVFCMSQSFVPKGHRWLSTILYLCGKVTASSSLRMSYLYTSELFPTYTRSTMLGLCSSLGRIAVLIAPQTPLLIKYWSSLPTLLVGILSLLTATVVTFMPDTSEDVLPDNVREAEAIGIRQKEKEVSRM